MTQYDYRINLNAARFPLTSILSGRTVIIPQYDQNFQKLANFSGGDQDRDIGIPQIYYAHNVIPTAEGLKSVSYVSYVPPIIPAATDFNQVFILQNDEEIKGLFVPSTGKNYIYQAVNAEWQSINPFTPGQIAENGLVTTAHLKAHTYIFYENTGCYEYDFSTNTISLVPFTGLVQTNLKGVCSSITYLITWDGNNTIYWSSALTPTDFVPSLSTGAGSEIPSDLRGSIVTILPYTGGFMIYTTKNAVFAAYSGNIRFPWVFREIPGSAGIKNPRHVTWEANAGYHIAWTTAGLMRIERTGVEILYPEITDFLANKVFEDYNSQTEQLEQRFIPNDYSVTITLVDSRYIILSYGEVPGIFTHALFIDLSLKRFGKLKIDHVDSFDWPVPNLFGNITYEMLLGRTYNDLLGTTYAQFSQKQITSSKAKRSITFLQSDGAIISLNFDTGDINDDAVLFLGKFQLTRSRYITFHRAETENVNQENVSNFNLKLNMSLDGKNMRYLYSPMLMQKNKNLTVHGGRYTGQNFTLQYSGAFDLASITLMTQDQGDR